MTPLPTDHGSRAALHRLSALGPLAEEAAGAFEMLLQDRVQRVWPNDNLFVEGEEPKVVRVILTGWALRYKMLRDGRRQIVNFLLPGDICDFNIFLLREMDHSVGALIPVSYAEIGREQARKVVLDHPSLTEALWREAIVSASIQREWSVNLGQRLALERTAHLICELFHRLRFVGLTSGMSCHFPLTQVDLADATGLSPVHVNRTIQELRARGLIALRSKTLTIPDLEALEDAGSFTAGYLHVATPDLAP